MRADILSVTVNRTRNPFRHPKFLPDPAFAGAVEFNKAHALEIVFLAQFTICDPIAFPVGNNGDRTRFGQTPGIRAVDVDDPKVMGSVKHGDFRPVLEFGIC